MRFSQDFINKVRDANNIVDIISQYTELKRSGGDGHLGLCPFPDHKEKTPSFSVSEGKQVYHCFGCKKDGNVYTFVQTFQGLNFPEAVEFLASRAGLPLPEPEEGQKFSRPQDKDRRKLLARVNKFAALYYHQQLKKVPADHPVRQYLTSRGLTDELVDKFCIGYAPDEWEGLVSALKRKGVPLDAAEEVGLIRRRTQGRNGHYDLFRQRLMFPIVSPTGDYIGFGGRILGEGHPKYINSPESSLFHKGRVFYGLDETAKYIRTADQAIVVEGYTDFLALYKAGFTHVVATLGTALTKDHARLLKRFTKNVVALFDGDQAGQEAAERSLPVFLAEGLLPKALRLPDKTDPDEFLEKEGAEALKAALSAARELFFEVMDGHFRGYTGSPSDKVQLVDAMAPILTAVVDPRLRELYVREVADRLMVEPAWLVKALKGGPQQRAANAQRPQASEPAQPQAAKPAPVPVPEKIRVSKNPNKAELFLLNLALMKEEFFHEIEASKVTERFSDSSLREIFERAGQAYRQMPNKFDSLTALLVDQVDPSSTVTLHLDKSFAGNNLGEARKLIADCTRKVEDRHKRTQSKHLAARLRGRSASEQLEILEQIMNIQKDRHSLDGE